MKNEEILIKKMYVEIDRIVRDDYLKTNFKRICKKYNLNHGIISGLLENNLQIQTLTDIEKGKIADIINETLSRDGSIVGKQPIDLEAHFTELEISDIKEYRFNIKTKEVTYPIVFENVIRLSPKRWVTTLTPQSIGALSDSNVTNYDYDTQREARKFKTATDDIVKAPTIYRKSINAITNEIITGTFKPNILTFNMVGTLHDELDFEFIPTVCEPTDYIGNQGTRINNGTTGTLIIKNGRLNVIDGFHRFVSIMSAMTFNPDLDMSFEVRITDYTQDEARQFMIQEDKRNKIAKSHITQIDETNRVRNIIEKLNTQSTSELKGMIASNRSLLSQGVGVVTFDTIYNNMSHHFDIKDRLSEDLLYRDVEQFFNYIVPYLSHISHRELRTDARLFSLLIAIFAKIRDEDMLMAVPQIIQSINSHTKEVLESFSKFSQNDGYNLGRKFLNEIEYLSEVIIDGR